MLVWAVAGVSLVLVAAGLVGFFADPLHLPDQLLDVLDRRASVISMFVGIAGLLVAGTALWTQLRSPAPLPAIVPSRLGSPVIGAPMAGSQVIGQVADSAQVSGPGSAHADRRSVAGQVGAPVMTGDGVMITGGIVESVGGVHLPPRPPVPARPVRLAPRPPQLAGRDQALAEVHRRLNADVARPSVLAVHGLGGVGKTSLTVEYAYRHQHAYQLVWQLPAEDTTVLSAAFADLAALLGVRQPGDMADPVHQVHATLAAHPGRWLILFDNAPDAEAVRAFLPPTGDGHILITSRSGHWPARHGMELPVLDDGPATVFLIERTGDDDQDAAAALVGELGALPLALEQAGAYSAAVGITLAGYLDLLRSRRAEMLAQGWPWGYDQQVASTWHLTFEHLSRTTPQAITLLRLLACYAPEDVPYRHLLASLDPDDPHDPHEGYGREAEILTLPRGELAVNAAVSALRRHCLVNRPAGGKVSVHRLVQAVTLDQLPPGQRTAWRQAAAALLQAVLPDAPESPDNWPRFAQLLPHARAAFSPASPALLTVAEYLAQSGNFRIAIPLFQKLHEAHTATLGAEHPQTLAVRHALVHWTGRAGEEASARDQLVTLLPVRERVLGTDHRDTLTTRYALAVWTGWAGDPVAARDQFAALLLIRERVLGAEDPDTLNTRNALAFWTGMAGDPVSARDQLAALLPIRERVLGAEHPDTLVTRSVLADWEGEAGDPVAARDQFAALLPIRERVLGTDHPDTFLARAALAHWIGQTGDPVAARDQFTALLPVCERVLSADHRDTLGVRHSLAAWTGRAGDPAAARDQLAALLPICERVLGTGHFLTLTIRYELANWTGQAGDPAAARDQLAALLPIHERVLGTDHPDTLATQHELGTWTKKAQ
ncbi:FxSxx-COOH system tetratricopeptide repeat protein [Streptosporangium sp. V21-05]|uniref:FxSxx-COOH system tetratricopeptide repeat protein n=1 Tax=Streptosporangium sp. V21-05 TaxID=3446115 RepID=UPI003F52AC0F